MSGFDYEASQRECLRSIAIQERELFERQANSGFFYPQSDQFTPGSSSIETFSAALLAEKMVPDRKWIVPDMIPDRSVTLLSGDGGSGKSLLALQLAVAVATGTRWIGMLPASGVTLYVSAEDDEDEVHRRLQSICMAENILLNTLCHLHVATLAGKDAVLASQELRSETIIPTLLWQALAVKITELKPRLVIIDTLADVFAGNENSRPQARQFISILRGAAVEHNLAVLLISHPSLTGLASRSGSSGSTAWSNSVRARLYLDRPQTEEATTSNANLRILRVLKANYAATGAETSLWWENGVLGLHKTGLSGYDPAVAGARAEGVFLHLLTRFTEQGRDVSVNRSSTYAPVLFSNEPEAKGLGKRTLEQAMSTLLRQNRIKVEKYGPPSKIRVRLRHVFDSQLPSG